MTNEYKRDDTIFIVSPHKGYIPPLRMAGPIPNPIPVTIYQAQQMLTSGIEIHQYDKASKSTLRLDVMNILDKDKFCPIPSVETRPESPVQEPVAMGMGGMGLGLTLGDELAGDPAPKEEMVEETKEETDAEDQDLEETENEEAEQPAPEAKEETAMAPAQTKKKKKKKNGTQTQG